MSKTSTEKKESLYPSFNRYFDVAKDIIDVIGGTPCVYLNALNTTKAKIILKLESNNPLGSVKDRLGMGIILKSERDGVLIPNKSVIVEATSGNTGISLAHVGAIRGYKVIITMPETMSMERRCLLRIFNADVILTPGFLGMKGAITMANKIVSTVPNAVLANQFKCKYNAEIHEETTGREIWEQTEGKVDFFVTGVGTGGTITGVAQYLKKRNPKVRIVAVEPTESPVISGGAPGPHKIQGIGAGFIPDVLEKKLIDDVVLCHSDEAISMAIKLARKEGIFCGFSSGANVHAALELAERPENEGKTIVTVIPSYGERYLSTLLYQSIYDECSKLHVISALELQ